MITDYYTSKEKQTDWSRCDIYGYHFKSHLFTFDFPDKAAYLAFVRDWKAEYRSLSVLTREARQAFRCRHRSAEGLDEWRARWIPVREFIRGRDLREATLEDECLIWPLKFYARFLLELRSKARETSKASAARSPISVA